MKGYAKVRSYAPRLFAAFTFHAEGKAASLVEALNLLRKMYAANKRTLSEHVPIGFVRHKWAGQVFRDGAVKRRAYELCVLDALRLALRAGDVWVAGSRKYKDLDAYLLPQGVWQRRLADLSLDLPETFESFWGATEPPLTGQLREVVDLHAKGALSSVALQRGKLRIGKVMKAVPDEVEPLERALSARLPRVKITDLLLEVNAWTRFTGAFLNLHSGKGAERHDHLLTAILADGLNLGLTKMSEASPDPSLTARRLMYLADWFVRPDSYAAGLAENSSTSSPSSLWPRCGEMGRRAVPTGNASQEVGVGKPSGI
ncbi:Tn3 family transposase [Deinococcus planocerae]|uniref:Tn3 family transposase n=1 Tax=Deinococcus planocerae TaxID=1737569 RepID=UPI001FEAAB3C|nr:Tn3 family transposase [Deinococcus planocerae]